MKKQILIMACAALGFAACSGGDSSNTATTETPAETPAAPEENSGSEFVTVNGDTTSVHITGNDEMKFNLKSITVKEGQIIKLTMSNEGTQPIETMGHNFILLKPGTDIMDYANKAASAKAEDYIPAAEQGSVLAHTKLLGPGESDTIIFAAPAAGEYEYLCSFPGHVAVMRGILIVEK